MGGRKRYFDLIELPCFLEPRNDCVPLLGVNTLGNLGH